jgi:phosphoglycerol transferase MdoB-like AlkP superfamily enzyme
MFYLKDLKVLVRCYIVFISVFLIHRLIFWISFKEPSFNVSYDHMIKSWWIGFRFDLRIITIFLLVGVIGFSIIRLLFKIILKSKNKSKENLDLSLNSVGIKSNYRNSILFKFYLKIQTIYVALGLLFFTIIFWVDIGNYAYLEERISSKMFALLSNPTIALGMVAQSYPLYLIIPSLVFVVWLFFKVTSKLVFSGSRSIGFFDMDSEYSKKDSLKFFVTFFVMAVFIHSKISQYPLRWSEAYFTKIHFINQFALDPVQNIFDTYKFSKSNFTLESVKKEISLVKKDLGLEDQSSDLLLRFQKAEPINELKDIKNVVVIMMESLAAFKLGTYGAPLNTSPNFDELAKESLLFENFHVIQTGTAASIFCLITGIPDLNEEETASRNPLVVDQHTMINNFSNQEKYYFIGGDANWGNIRGVIKNNIEDVNLFEEKDFVTASKNDIWGISDLELFNQANQKLESLEKPFFAFIQTAGYHKPYTIPNNTEGFETKTISEKEINDYGFNGEAEFNALRFADHALGHFFKLAKKSKYYKNTLFVVYADHGLRSFNPTQLSQYYKTHFFPITHIPFLVHSPLLPKSMKGVRDTTLGFEPDILPTIQSMLGIEGPNSTFGLDLRSDEAKQRKGIFLRGSGAVPVRFFDGTRMIYTGLEKKSEIKSFKTNDFIDQLMAIKEDTFSNIDEPLNKDIISKAELGRAYFKVIKYKLKNNQKSKISKYQIGFE